jgi:uncharacterized membrane protein YphA (DoxX/SURF4 family)
MKIAALVARLLLGLLFTVFGLNMFLHFIPTPPGPPGAAGQFATLLGSTHYILAVGAVMVVSGVLLLIGRFIPLALTLLGPVLVNILLFHLFMAPASIGMGLFATLLWFILFARHRTAFAGIFRATLPQ